MQTALGRGSSLQREVEGEHGEQIEAGAQKMALQSAGLQAGKTVTRRGGNADDHQQSEEIAHERRFGRRCNRWPAI